MVKKDMNAQGWKDWTIFGLRWLLLVGISLTIYLWRTQTNPAAPLDINDFLIPFGAGVVATLLFGATFFAKSLKMATPFVLIVGDWIIAGLYINLVQADPVLTMVITALFLVPGILRLDAVWGGVHFLVMSFIAIGMTIYLADVEQLSELEPLLPSYVVPLGGLLLFGLVVSIWVYARDRFDSTATLDRIVKARAKQLDDMRERARTISEMTDALIGSNKFDHILQATLNIGELSLQANTRVRLIGMVMLFRAYDEMLYVASTRGLRFIDKDKVIPGKTGIIGETLTECVPIIGKNPHNDPELRQLGVFTGLRSVLCIPLRAHFDNYGIVIFATEERDAFNEDHLDTLNAIGVQATVALQNAVLYKNLMAEKERIIEMEEDARKALVRDLHDIPTQTISAVAMRLSIVQRMMTHDPGGVPAELASIEELTRETIEQIRHVLFTLRPLALEDQGLTAALHQLGEKVHKTHGQPVTVKVAPNIEDYLDDNQQGALFYFIEEAVNNARKYAKAPMITVQVGIHQRMLAVRIADNGQGFDIEKASRNEKGSFGLINMQERIGLLDGTVTLDSAIGKGTTITALVPLDPDKINRKRRQNGRQRQDMTESKIQFSAERQLEEM